MSATWRVGTLLAALLLSIAAGGRWIGAVASSADRIVAEDGPSVVLVLQEGDCPDRRAGMLRWIRTLDERREAGPTVTLRLALLGRGSTTLPPELQDFSELARAELRRAERALLRAGVGGTPALLLLDSTGHVAFADEFTEEGPGDRFSLLKRLAAAGPPGGSVEPSMPFQPPQ